MRYQLNPLMEAGWRAINRNLERKLFNLKPIKKECLLKIPYKGGNSYKAKLYRLCVKGNDGKLTNKYMVSYYGDTMSKTFNNKEESVSFVKSILSKIKHGSRTSGGSIARDVQGHGYGEYINGGLARNSLRFL